MTYRIADYLEETKGDLISTVFSSLRAGVHQEKTVGKNFKTNRKMWLFTTVVDLWNSLPEATGHRSLHELQGRLEICYGLVNKLNWKKSNVGKWANGECQRSLPSPSPEICFWTHLENTGALRQLSGPGRAFYISLCYALGYTWSLRGFTIHQLHPFFYVQLPVMPRSGYQYEWSAYIPILLSQKHWNYHLVSYFNFRSYNSFCSSGDDSYFCFHLFWLVAIAFLLWKNNLPFYQPNWYAFFFRNAEVVKIALFLHITESQSKLT